MRNGRRSFLFLNLFFLLFLSACQKDLPEPEAKATVIPMSSVQTANVLPAVASENKGSFVVQHYVQDQNVFVECMIPNFSFREQNKNKGRMVLFVNGEKKEEITTAAFIIKGLTPGTHQIKLEVYKSDDDQHASLSKEFSVSIP